MRAQDIINMLDEFSELDEKTLKEYGVDIENWIPEDYWQGFVDAINGLKQYLMKG